MQRPTISGPRPSLLHFLLACVFASYFFSLSTALPISVRRRTALAPRAIPNRLSDNPEPFWKAVSPDGRTVPANVRNDVDIFIHEWLNPQAEAGKLRPDDWLSYAGRPDSRNARTVDTLVRPEHMDQNQISGTEAAATLYKEGARGLKKLNKKLAPKVTAVINSIMRLFGGKNKQRIVGTAAEIEELSRLRSSMSKDVETTFKATLAGSWSDSASSEFYYEDIEPNSDGKVVSETNLKGKTTLVRSTGRTRPRPQRGAQSQNEGATLNDKPTVNDKPAAPGNGPTGPASGHVNKPNTGHTQPPVQPHVPTKGK